MIQVYPIKADMNAADLFMFEKLFSADTLNHGRAFVIAGSHDELDYFRSMVENLEIRYNQADFTLQDCPIWYGVVCW
jgi:hypothetical protein